MPKRTVSPQHEMRFTGFGICEMANIDPGRNRRRYYCISLQPGLFELILKRQWGRLGCRQRVKDEYCENLESALKRANRIYRERLRNGYREM